MRSGGARRGSRGRRRAAAAPADAAAPPQVLTVRRAHGDGAPTHGRPGAAHRARLHPLERGDAAIASSRDRARRAAGDPAVVRRCPYSASRTAAAMRSVFEFPVAASAGRAAYVAGTFDTKGVRAHLPQPVPRASIGMRAHRRPRDIGQAFAGDGASARSRGQHPGGEEAFHRRSRFRGDRNGAPRSRASSRAARPGRPDLAPAVRAARRSPPPAMRPLPVGVPKVMVSTVASRRRRPYVGPPTSA